MSLRDDISTVKGVGVKTRSLLQKLDITTKAELLSYFPRTYDKYEEAVSIREVKNGMTAVIYAAPKAYPTVKVFGSRKLLFCEVYDGSGTMEVNWFNMPYLKSKLKKGVHLYFRGQVRLKGKQFVMTQPEILTEAEFQMKKAVLQPIYPLTKGITGHFLRKSIMAVLPEMTASIDYLPSSIKKEEGLLSLRAAVEEIHFPKSYSTMMEARKRLVFDEFFLFSLSIAKMKREKKEMSSDFVMKKKELLRAFLFGLPFRMTEAQKKVWKEMEEDLTGGFRMNRLIQGDVGSGKTLLAELACLLAAENGYQASVMVPTEVLAVQHFENFKAAFSTFGIETVLLTGSVRGKERTETLRKIETGEADIIIGTHALIQENVVYADLALVITDEQHRFGVRQREKLMEKGKEPHVAVMSATPIPRTLAVILYGDLDISLVDELPAERLPVKNCVVDENYRQTSYRFIEEEVKKGHQAYIICPMIEKKEEEEEAADVIYHTEEVKNALSGSIRVEALHGKMKNEVKNRILEEFSKGKIHVLVSTTVVEVGINVPNATVMMIENAERFGLATLHQLRGRIGRGKHQSYCIFMSSTESEEAKKRLMILKNSNDGFQIAEEDMKLRGSGDIFGIRQSGEMLFSVGDIIADANLLKAAGESVKRLSDKMREECYDKGRMFYRKHFMYGDEIGTL